MAMASSSRSISTAEESRHDHASSHRPSPEPLPGYITMPPSSSSSVADSSESFFVSISKIVQRTARIRNLDDGRSLWLHGQMCKEIVSAFVRLTHQLNDPSIRSVIDASSSSGCSCSRSEPNLGPLKAATGNLLRVMKEGEKFVEWCHCAAQRRKGPDRETVWMRKALWRGLSIEPAETHLHDFMMAVCILRDAIRICTESDAMHVPAIDPPPHLSPASHTNLSGRMSIPDQSLHRRLHLKHLHLPPDKFWEDDDVRDPAYVLLDAGSLDSARNADVNQMEKDLNIILRHPASQGDDFKADLAKLLQEKIKDYRHRSGEVDDGATVLNSSDMVDASDRYGGEAGTSSTSYHKYPDLTSNFYGDFRDIEILEKIYPPKPGDVTVDGIVEIHKVRWRPAGTDTIFALKLYWGGAQAYFQIEAPIHLRLHHPNIVQSFCVFKDAEHGRYFGLLMELMEQNLTQFLHRSRNHGLATKIYIMLQIAKGMAYLQSKGFIHRDLKPENVLISEDYTATADIYPHDVEIGEASSSSKCRLPVVKIADFNTARPVQIESGTAVTKLVGTSIYRAPEVMKEDDESEYGASVDVYSFAMVSFKILSGREAFQGETGRMKMIGEGRRPDLARELSDCPAYLQRCLEAWWDPSPERRPSFNEICRVLRHLYGALVRGEGKRAAFLDVNVLDVAVWRTVHEKARQEMQKLEALRRDRQWRHCCKHSAVNEIPYEMYTMNFAEMALEVHLQKVPEQETKQQKSGMLACLSSCFSFCMSETPRPRLGTAIRSVDGR